MAEVVDTDKIEVLGRIPKREKEALSRLHIFTIRDLLMHIPVRYVDSAIAFTPEDIIQNEVYTLYGVIQNAKTTRSFKGHVPMTKCKLDTGVMKVDLIFFHQAYISKMYPDGTNVRIIGKIENKSGAMQIVNPKIEKVTYTGLEDSMYHERAKQYLKNGFGSVFMFDVKGGYEAAVKVINSLKLTSHLANVGDAKTLAIHPASTTHEQLTDAEQISAGVSKGGIRISVGIEHIDDIKADIEQALEKSK